MRMIKAHSARVGKGLCLSCQSPRGEDGTSHFCRSCAEKNNARTKKSRQKKINRGLCAICGEPRGEGGTSQYCRLCAQKNTGCKTRLQRERNAVGKCIACGQPLGPDGGKRRCRACLDRAEDGKAATRARRGTRLGVYICVNGVCVNCHKHTGGDEEYTACQPCHFKYLSKTYLGTGRRWAELQDLWERQGGRCPYTGIKLEFGVDASLDHIQPSSLFPELAKDISNMEFVHSDINRMKGDMSREDFLDFVKLIHTNLQLEKEADDPYGLFANQD